MALLLQREVRSRFTKGARLPTSEGEGGGRPGAGRSVLHQCLFLLGTEKALYVPWAGS